MILDTILDIGSKIIDRVIPDKKSADEAKLKLLELQQNGDLKLAEMDNNLQLAQIETNKIEASSDNVFKSGWRPFVGWTCALSLFYDMVFRPLCNAFLSKHGITLENLDTSELMMLLFSLLGMSSIRTFDKFKKLK